MTPSRDERVEKQVQQAEKLTVANAL